MNSHSSSMLAYADKLWKAARIACSKASLLVVPREVQGIGQQDKVKRQVGYDGDNDELEQRMDDVNKRTRMMQVRERAEDMDIVQQK